MFNKKYEKNLSEWNAFRKSLESSETPFEDVLNLYQHAPLVSIQVDPYDPSTWLNPWELILENQYCEFSKILGICYTLQLTDRFMNEDFEIHIITNNIKSETYYLLFIQEKVFGYDWSRVVDKSELPSDLQSQKIYSMPKLQ